MSPAGIAPPGTREIPIRMAMKIILICVLVIIVLVAVLLFTPLGERPLSALFRIDGK